MNYRHAFHAGNFADVAKHIALTAVLLHLRRKETAFAVVDTHAGRGLYDLAGEAATRTGEAAAGIARLRELERGSLTEALQTYLQIADGWGVSHYPGSPLIAARLLRPQDRLVAIEKHPDEVAALRAVLRPFTRARAFLGDGYERLPALLPPAERRGVVLIDPPYEAPDDFSAAARAMTGALRRFATGIYLIWFPVKSKTEADGFCGELLAAGVAKALRIDIAVAVERRDEKTRLAAAGLVVVNPPYGLDAEMAAALALLAPQLGSTGQVTWLATG